MHLMHPTSLMVRAATSLLLLLLLLLSVGVTLLHPATVSSLMHSVANTQWAAAAPLHCA
jgi:hypothetical protein